MFRHPKYYKELRKRNRDLSELQQVKLERSVPQSDQVISLRAYDGERGRAPGPGLKLPGPRPISNANKGLIHRRQASSAKQQASSESKPEPSSGSQAASDKPLSHKHRDQASSHKQQAQ